LNVGLDALTLLPGIGTIAKGKKLAQTIAKSPAVAKALQLAFAGGMGGYAVYHGTKTAYENIKSGN
jgi:hypothetical protein